MPQFQMPARPSHIPSYSWERYLHKSLLKPRLDGLIREAFDNMQIDTRVSFAESTEHARQHRDVRLRGKTGHDASIDAPPPVLLDFLAGAAQFTCGDAGGAGRSCP